MALGNSDHSCLLAAALQREIRALRPLAEKYELRLLKTGLGGRSTRKSLAQALLEQRPSIIIFSGVAGALSAQLELGQVVLPRRWTHSRSGSFTTTEELVRRVVSTVPSVVQADLGLTVDKPVLSSSSRKRLFQETGATICDMEAAHVLDLAQQHSIPALAAKVVSDTPDCSLVDFWRNLENNLHLLRAQLDRILEVLAIPGRDRP